MTDITQADRDELRLWIEDGCPEGVAGIPEQLTRLLDDHEAAFQAGVKAGEDGWIIGNAKRNKWRTWKTGEPEWTTDSKQATRFARREDAEAVHLNDEDAWLVVQFCAIDPTSIKDTQP